MFECLQKETIFSLRLLDHEYNDAGGTDQSTPCSIYQMSQQFSPYLMLKFYSRTDLNGIDLTPVQDTPVASRKEDTYIHFNVDIEIQKHVEKLTKGLLHEDLKIMLNCDQ